MPVMPISFHFPKLEGVHCLFTSKNNGDLGLAGAHDSPVPDSDRKAFFTFLSGIGVRRLAELAQVHGDELVINPEGHEITCDGQVSEFLRKADGVATDMARLALLVRTADCQPILFAHVSGRYLMALHVGWRGNRINFIRTAVRQFCGAYGIAPRDLLAVRGPSLGPCCAEFINFFQEWGSDFLPVFDGRNRHVDLWNLTERQLLAAGLENENIFSIDICTRCNSGLFFSYRAEKTSYRQCGLIWRE